MKIQWDMLLDDKKWLKFVIFVDSFVSEAEAEATFSLSLTHIRIHIHKS